MGLLRGYPQGYKEGSYILSRPTPFACTQALSVLESPAALKREQSKLLAFEILCTAAIMHKKVIQEGRREGEGEGEGERVKRGEEEEDGFFSRCECIG